MMKFRTRLIFGILISVFFVLASLGIVIGQLLKGFYSEELEQRIGKEAALGAVMLETESEDNWESVAHRLSNTLDVHAAVINSTGDIVTETSDEFRQSSFEDLPEVENGSIIRYHPSSGDDFLFYAYPFEYGEGEEGYLRLSLPMERINEVNRKIWSFLGVSFSLAFILITTLSYRIANQLTYPIEQVKEVAQELANGNFSARAEESSKDEIGQLTWSINQLAYNLGKVTSEYNTQHERLEALIDHMGSGLIFIDNRGDISLINQYCKDIFNTDTDKWIGHLYHEVMEDKAIIQLIQEIFLTENKVRSQIQLTHQSSVDHYEIYGAPILGRNDKLRGIVLVFHDITELKNLEQVRKDFVANVSHELKTPVTSLKGFAETLLGGAMKDEKASAQFLEIIWKESDRLQHLIHDLLELSKIEQQHFHLNRQVINLSHIAKETTELLQPKAEEKNIALQIDTKNTVHIIGDNARLKQILINLINNAIVYTPEGGVVKLEISKQANEAVLTVQDTGIGIPESELPRIFERFYRVNKDRSRNSGGTGLGLAIVKHLTEAHDGVIQLESEEGEGTTFILTFPIYVETKD